MTIWRFIIIKILIKLKIKSNQLRKKIYKPNNRSVTLHSVTYFVNTVFLRAAIVDINGTTITWRASDSGWGTMNRTDCNTTSENVFFINQIIGYK